jgi:LemA protein
MMKKWGIGCGIVVVLIVIGLTILAMYSGVWNRLNSNYQAVEEARSKYGAALDVCTEKIKGVWTITNQYMDHESKTFQAVAQARAGYDAATKAFETAMNQGKGTRELTQAGTEVVQAALAFRIQVEAYPQLRAVETSTENIRNMEVATNEIKTALDDWVTTIKDYNTYRGSFVPNLIGSSMKRFPAQIDYYEGRVKELNVEDLNPEKP